MLTGPVRGPADDRDRVDARPSCSTCRQTAARCAWRTSPSPTTCEPRAGRSSPGAGPSRRARWRCRRRRHGHSASTSGARPRSPPARAAPGAELTVVGTFVPRPGAAWARGSRCSGTGVGPHYRGYISAYGPFVVAPAALDAERGAAAPGHPARAARPGARDRRRRRPGPARRSTRSAASCRARWATAPRTSWWTCRSRARSTAARAQRGVTGSGVLSVALLGGALAGTTVLLAARLVAARRASEVVLLVARGASRRRLVAQASAEAAYSPCCASPRLRGSRSWSTGC